MGLNYSDIENTWKEASVLMRRLRGKVLLYDLLSLFFICGMVWIMIAFCIVLGILVSFLLSTIVFLVYLWAVGNFAFWSRRRSTRYLRIAHFVLAVYLRAENNRLYWSKHVLLRPGYWAKWIEFIIDRRYIPKDLNSSNVFLNL